MNILLTGSNGFLGSIIKKELSNGNNLTTLSRSNSDYIISLEKEVPLFKESFDLVIHAAGKAHSLPKTESEKKQFYEVNFLGTENLLKGLEKSFLPKEFVFISSVSVYGLETGVNINEDHTLLAQDPYGLSKLNAEKLIINWCKENKVVCTILRLPLLVGKNPPGNLGAMVNAISKGYYFNIGKGQARKSMVLGIDVASLIPSVCSIGGIYNLTDGFHPSFYELSLAISKNKKRYFNLPVFWAKNLGKIGDLLGENSPINSLKVKKMTSDLIFDDSKARKILNWNPEIVLEYLKRETLD
ncbi:NAD-dependent epimerase/dehydratase family protein [Flavobacterium sp. MR2016-29]|uniref:NAD-dependent epimerase/dehydratase family protein n=1 Tax=Flavobacterium sp. MR2016-29 TaxID=2783795 RepID=UPI00188B5B20|nr:NAD-dependent epimerase/dehydratase family protein [Flavobacterium sp. MR2016-29]MBF4492896.1 NAD-dependent epimerase/dehydratase family protein [Flavobacterium sp. MR2016-29]